MRKGKKRSSRLRHRFSYSVLGLCLMSQIWVSPLSAQSQKLTLEKQETTLGSVMKEIEEQTDLRFFYSGSLVDVNKVVTIDMKDKNLSEVLSQLFSPTNINWRISGNQILLFSKVKEGTKQVPDRKVLVKGVVVDASGIPLIGVNIKEKGTNNGTITDMDGGFSLTVSGKKAVLQMSYVGYAMKEIQVGQETSFKIVMEEDTKTLSEVVVVGYGTQKKVNLTGSVAVAAPEDIKLRPISSVSNGLQGLLPGVTVVSSTGLPGQSSSTIRIRGVGTTGNADPLILIDGVEGDINLLNPEDIESLSVLKDAASASIYGARGANGVILVTTKNVGGKEAKPTINLNGYYGLQTPTRLPEMVDAATYIKMDMEATKNVGKPANYTEAHLQKVLDGSDPDYFSNTNWIDQLYRGSAPQQNYNLNVSGKSKGMGYYISYGYLDQEGLTVGNTTKSKRHNIRTKLNTVIADRLDVTANFGCTYRDYTTPSGGFSEGGGALYSAMSISPLIPVRFTDGRWGYGGGSANPVALLYDSGTNDFSSQEVNANFVGKLKIMDGWDATATYSFIQSNSLREILSKTINYYRPGTNEIWYSTNPTNKLDERDYTSIKQTFIAQTNFERKFGKHTLSAVLGFSQEWYTEKNFTAQRTGLQTEKNPSLGFGSQDSQTNSASAASWAIRSGFGRINYNFDERYLLEANLRYDLTSRFFQSNRGGVFPSFSGAWRISEEYFWKENIQAFDNLKLRLSWGILGNQYVGSNDYPYLAVIGSVGSIPHFGTKPSDGYSQSTLANPNLTWETIHMTNIGVDLTFLRNRLNVSADYFVKDTKDILLKLSYPGVLGLAPTEQNAGKVRNQGWELNIQWADKIGEVSYGLGFNISDVRNKITDFGGLPKQLTNDGHSIREVGYPIDAFYGYVALGLATPEDFERYNPSTGRYENPKFPVLVDDASDVQPGDIILQDISGPEGVPDGKIDADYDRKVIGSSIPRYTYTARGNLEWKGFDFSFMLQGVGKANGVITGSGRHAFLSQSNYPQTAHLDHWSFENPDPNAAYPRLTFDKNYNQKFSTFWMENAAYLRLKNVQLGYSFSQPWMEKLNLEKLRIYFSGDNLLTFTDFFYAYDPETPRQSGGLYPQVKTFVFGFNMTFK